MKLFLASLILVVALPAIAEEKKPSGGKKLEEIKPEVLSHLDQRISFLQEAKSCVQSAQDHKAMKECRKKLHESMKSIKKDRKDHDKDED